jgi:hypothetical protein
MQNSRKLWYDSTNKLAGLNLNIPIDTRELMWHLGHWALHNEMSKKVFEFEKEKVSGKADYSGRAF